MTTASTPAAGARPSRGGFGAAALDIRYALRSLRHQPVFAFVAVITLALGIGANTAVFSVVHAVLLRPLPYAEPERLVAVWETDAKSGSTTSWVSYPDFEDFRRESGMLAGTAVYRGFSSNLVPASGEPERVRVLSVSADLLAVLGVTPAAGRVFAPEDDAPGREGVAVLTHAFAARQGQSPGAAVGTSVAMDGVPYVVVGVLPPGFRFLLDADVWVVAGDGRARTQRGMHTFRMIARLADGATIEEAQAELASVARALEQQYPQSNAGRGVRLEPLSEHVVGDSRTMLLVVFGAVGLVLLVACANIANLLLARAGARSREVAVRAALGAGRVRLVQQFTIESLLLSAAGGIIGLLLAGWSLRLLVRIAGDAVPRIDETTIDATVLIVSLAMTVAAGLLCGVAPAVHATRPDLASMMRGETATRTGARRSRMAPMLVVAETALAVMLVVAAGLLVRSYWRLNSVDPGFDPQNVLSFRLGMPISRYPEAEWRRTAAFVDRLLGDIRGLPGVQSAMAGPFHPLDEGFTTSFIVEGRPPAPTGMEPESSFRPVTPGYFEAMRVPLRRGRTFDAADAARSTGVAVINDAMARRFFGGEDPIGQRFSITWPSRVWPGVPGSYEIVGIVGDERFAGLRAPAEPAMYFPYAHAPMNDLSVVVRSSSEGLELVSALRGRVSALDPALPMFEIATLEEIMSVSLGAPRFSMLLLTLFALLALTLAIVGVYGITAYSVAHRIPEIGVRMALGADRTDVVALIVRQAMGRVATGIGLGIAGALVAARSLASLLYGVSPWDPSTLAAVAVALGLAGLAASYLPARAAARVDPVVALRSH